MSTVYPLLLFLFVEKRDLLGEAGIRTAIRDLESFIVRRAVCGLTSKNYNRLFVSAMRAVRQAKSDPAAALREQLLAGDGDAVRWPNDREFGREWMNAPAYKRLKPPPRVRMLLEALERRMRTSHHESMTLHQTLTIEHVMPQGWREQWGPPETAGGQTVGETSEERRDRIVHSFGNLTLLTQEMNSGVSNGPFEAKRAVIATSLLRLNEVFQHAGSWSEATIRQRGRALFDVARDIWPHPHAEASLADIDLDVNGYREFTPREGDEDESEDPTATGASGASGQGHADGTFGFGTAKYAVEGGRLAWVEIGLQRRPDLKTFRALCEELGLAVGSNSAARVMSRNGREVG